MLAWLRGDLNPSQDVFFLHGRTGVRYVPSVAQRTRVNSRVAIRLMVRCLVGMRQEERPEMSGWTGTLGHATVVVITRLSSSVGSAWSCDLPRERAECRQEGQVAPVAQHKQQQERLHPWLLADQGLGAQRRETKEGGRRAAPRPAIGQRGRFWSVTIQVGEGAVGRDSRR
jgi:hypothetical protein